MPLILRRHSQGITERPREDVIAARPRGQSRSKTRDDGFEISASDEAREVLRFADGASVPPCVVLNDAIPKSSRACEAKLDRHADAFPEITAPHPKPSPTSA